MKSLSKIKGFILGILTAVIIYALCSTAFAASSIWEDNIHVVYPGISLIIDGTKVIPKDTNGNIAEPFIYNGTTYLPIRAVANAFNKKVTWDGNTNTIYLDSDNTDNNESGVNIGESTDPEKSEPVVINDSLTGPLSTNWNIGKQTGSWAVNKNGLGTYNSGSSYGYLPLSTNNYSPSNDLTLECDISPYIGVGIYLKGDNNVTTKPYTVLISNNDISGSLLQIYEAGKSSNSHQISLDNLSTDDFHHLKVVLKGNSVDIYIDYSYMFSDEIPVESQLGNQVGLYCYGSEKDFIKNFTATINPCNEDIVAPTLTISPNGGKISVGAIITITATDPNGIGHIGYAWDNDATIPVYSNVVKITVPKKSGYHILKYYAKDASSNYNFTQWKSIEFNISY